MSSKSVKIAQPYAEAFLDLFSKDSTETVINDLSLLSSSISGSLELKTLLSNPLINSQTKKNIIRSLFNEKLDNKTLKFLSVLCDRGRISYVDAILDRALELAYKAASIETVKVTSSVALNSSQQEALTSKLKKITGADQIKLDLHVNPNLIGGFIIQVGSKIIDTSIQGQLRDLSSYLGAPIL
jgi:F-type H+-transporting ATPase subunit delta